MGPAVLKWGIRWLWLHSFLLVITGVFLIFFYRPTAADAWEDIFALQNEVTASIAFAFAMTAAMLFTRRRSSLRLSTPDIEALG